MTASTLGTLPRIALVQMEVVAGRPDLNTEQMRRHIAGARAEGAEIVVFSELCVSGYLIGDLWEVDALVDDFAGYSEEVREASAGLTVLFGNVAVDPVRVGEDGRRLKYNAVYVAHDGEYVCRPVARRDPGSTTLPGDVSQVNAVPGSLPHGVHPKTLHPNYRFFDDDRHFYSVRKLALAEGYGVADWLVPYEVALGGGRRFRFGVQLCEDIWCEDYMQLGDTLDTLRVYHERGAQAVFNLSASPWTWRKRDKRNRIIEGVLARSPVPFFYVNNVGAQNNGKNILVFDGDTAAYSSQGAIYARAKPWHEQRLMVGATPSVARTEGESANHYHAILMGLRHFARIRGVEPKFLLGVSGGVDSALVAAMLCQAFGASNVFGVNMPTRFNSDLTQSNARHLCGALGMELMSFPIEELYQTLAARLQEAEFAGVKGNYSGIVDENVQARIRGGDVLSGLAAKFGLVFSNNGNKTETALGYATLYGDINGAVAPIGDLYKPQVVALCRYLNETVFGCEVVPTNLLDGSTVASAELSAAQDVTQGLGDPIKYGYHDAVIRQMIEYRRHPMALMEWFLQGRLLAHLQWTEVAQFADYFSSSEDWLADLEWVYRQVQGSYFKRIQAPPIIVLSKRAFGFDLRESQLPSYEPRAYSALRQKVAAAPLDTAFRELAAPPVTAQGSAKSRAL